ncbi:MAG: chaperonin GroEL [Romboutsia sp.]|nr:chaperonin GroEL [Romboutsia sp.]
MDKKLTYGTEAQKGLQEGINIIAEAVKTTLGARGRNVLIEDMYGGAPHITKDGVTVAKAIDVSEPIQAQGIKLMKQVALNTNTEVGDGCQPLHSKVLTPFGWKKMGELQIGDYINTVEGDKQYIIDIFPKGRKKLYRITLGDGSSTLCTGGHLWSVITNKGVPKLLTTKQLLESNNIVKFNKNNHKKHGFYIPQPIIALSPTNWLSLELSPYLIGVLLGDGYLNGKTIEITIGKNKKHILDKLSLPKGIYLKITEEKEKNSLRVKFKGKTEEGKSMVDLLKEIGMYNMTSLTKRIPELYLFTYKTDRKNLLQGLIDTDGYINKRGKLEYSTVSKGLAEDVKFLCKSLEKSVNIYSKQKSKENSFSDNLLYTVTELKGYKYGLPIISIEDTNTYEDVQCIKVSSKDNLYITDDLIITHNTTTSTVLAQAIIEKGLEKVKKGVNPIYLQRGINLAVDVVCKSLKEQAKQVEGNKDFIKQIASISANNDTFLGNLIGDAFEKVGKYGVIKVAPSKNSDTYVEHIKGMKFDSGLSNQMFIDPDKRSMTLNNPYILVTDYMLNEVSDFGNTDDTNLLNKVLKNNDTLVIICDEIDTMLEQKLVLYRKTQNTKIFILKAPEYGQDRTEVLKDIAILTGGQFVSKENGIKLNEVDYDSFGTCEKLETDTENTTIIDGAGDKEEIEHRVNVLQELVVQEETEHSKDKLKERIAKLSGGVAVLHVGAKSEIELREIMDRVDDAINATKAAIEEGVVAGGGIALAQCKFNSIDYQEIDNEEFEGLKIINDILSVPFQCIVENAGEDVDIIKNKLADVNEKNYGYDVKGRSYGDMFKLGILDPVKVTKTALRNAASVASTLLTTQCVITNIEREDSPDFSI